MKPQYPLLAIYDENVMQVQLLHNKLEQLGFAVVFSCTTKEKLFQCLKSGSVPAILLIGTENLSKRIAETLKNVNTYYDSVVTLIYSGSGKVNACEFERAGAKRTVANCNVPKIVSCLDEMLPDNF